MTMLLSSVVFLLIAFAHCVSGYRLRHNLGKSISLESTALDIRTKATVTTHGKLLQDYETVSRLLPDEVKALVQKLLTMKELGEKGDRAEAHAIAAAVVQQSPDLSSSIAVLNDLIARTQNKIAIMAIECKDRIESQKEMRETLGSDVSRLASNLANGRASLSEAQSCIESTRGDMRRGESDLFALDTRCNATTSSTQNSLKTLTKDLAAGKKMLEKAKCKDAGAASALQVTTCKACRASHVSLAEQTPSTRVSFVDRQLQGLADTLQSKEAISALQRALLRALPSGGLASFLDTSSHPSGHHGHAHVHYRTEVHDQPEDKHEDPAPSAAPTHAPLEAAPATESTSTTTAPVIGSVTEKATLGAAKTVVEGSSCCKMAKGSADCNRVYDSLSGMVGEIEDDMETQKAALATNAADCSKNKGDLLEAANEQQLHLSRCSQQLGDLTGRLADITAQLKTKEAAFDAVNKEIAKTDTDCGAIKGEGPSCEVCALQQIRTEMLSMMAAGEAPQDQVTGLPKMIQDCVVSEWQEGVCSAKCAGGTMNLTRMVVSQPDGGAACPVLTAKKKCNLAPCPLDCELGDWSPWQKCSVKCGGGVMSRMRSITRQPEYKGHPCAETQDTKPCNIQACDRDCELADWSEWGGCDKACGGGMMTRERAVKTEKVGDGQCAPASDSTRLEYKKCNEQICPANLFCKSRIDLVMLVDSSGSVSRDGFETLYKPFVTTLLGSLQLGEAAVKVGLVVFGTSATSWAGLSGAASILTSKIQEMPFFGDGTNTADALLAADSMLKSAESRVDAKSVVLLITDGPPTSKLQAKNTAAKLTSRSSAFRIFALAVGPAVAPLKQLQYLLTAPYERNYLHVKDPSELNAALVQQLIPELCPELGERGDPTIHPGVGGPTDSTNSTAPAEAKLISRGIMKPLLSPAPPAAHALSPMVDFPSGIRFMD